MRSLQFFVSLPIDYVRGLEAEAFKLGTNSRNVLRARLGLEPTRMGRPAKAQVAGHHRKLIRDGLTDKDTRDMIAYVQNPPAPLNIARLGDYLQRLTKLGLYDPFTNQFKLKGTALADMEASSPTKKKVQAKKK
jgi:hypothetical protein